jgi:hypothetical protein
LFKNRLDSLHRTFEGIVEISNETKKLIENVEKQTYENIYFIVYLTNNLLKGENDENRFYVGEHSQINVNPYEFDGYLGSGTVLDLSIKKHGKE